MIEKIESGTLPSEKEWIDHIESLRKKTKKSDIKKLKVILEDAVKKRIKKESVGLLFSGGIDSVLLATILKKFKANFFCFCVGTKNSPDVIAAKKSAEILRLNLIIKEFDEDDILKIFKDTVKLYKNPSAIDLAIGSVVFSAIRLGKRFGIKTFFTGLGAEDLFAGYHKYRSAENINKECWNGLKTTYSRDFLRDFPIAEFFKVNFSVPFYDEKVIMSAMGISGEKKINKDFKKVPLREVAVLEGVPEEFAWRKKKAAQYGSGFNKILEKFAKKKKMTKAEFVKDLN